MTGRVVDHAGVLMRDEATTLERTLQRIEAETSNQIVILLVPSLGGESIEDFGIRVARAWALGQKGRDNGVLILVAVEDRQMRIEVGYSLEGALTDAQSSYIIRNIIAPSFRDGRYAEGLVRGVDAVAAAIAGEFRAEPSAPRAAEPDGGGVLILAFALLVLAAQLARNAAISGGVGGALGAFSSAWLFGLGWTLIVGAALGAIAGVAFYAMQRAAARQSRGNRRRGHWYGGSRGPMIGGFGGGFGGFGGGGFGGGFSGGGGGFGGGGASGRW